MTVVTTSLWYAYARNKMTPSSDIHLQSMRTLTQTVAQQTFACRNIFPSRFPWPSRAAHDTRTANLLVADIAGDFHSLHWLAGRGGRGHPIFHSQSRTCHRCHELDWSNNFWVWALHLAKKKKKEWRASEGVYEQSKTRARRR